MTPNPNKHNSNKLYVPKAIICDIDGTICDSLGRTWEDYGSIQNDVIIQFGTKVKNMLFSNLKADCIIYLTARKEDSRNETLEWLARNQNYQGKRDFLYMKPVDHTGEDVDYKQETFLSLIDQQFNVLSVLDDNVDVCKMFNSLGIDVLQIYNQ